MKKKEEPNRGKFLRNWLLYSRMMCLALSVVFLVQSKTVFAQSLTVSGTVYDENNETLIGVSVVIKGTTQGVTTNLEGQYVLADVPADAVLEYRYMGYLTREEKVNGRKIIDVKLIPDSKQLEEVVVVGYSTQKKVNLTGAVTSVGSEVLSSRPVSNAGQALQGVIPNLNVSIANGSPNTEPTFNVRGGTSITKDNDGNNVFSNGAPLILVDGLEMDINTLNPDDIENITVLKDAASAAIYGARAAYGVMLVTTKKGRKGSAPRISYTGNFQWNKAAHIPDLMDSYNIQKAMMEAKVLTNGNVTSSDEEFLSRLKAYQDDPENAPVYYMNADGSIQWCANVNPYKEAIRNSAPMQKHNLSISGGSEKSTYYMSFGYQYQEGLYKLNTDKFNRYNIMMNLNTDITSWWTVGGKISYNKTLYHEPVSPSGKGGWWTAMGQEWDRNILMPLRTPKDSPVGEMYTDNILSFMDYGSKNSIEKVSTFLMANTELRVMKGLKLKGDFSYKFYDKYRKQVVPELKRIEKKWGNPTTAHTSPDYVQKWQEHYDYYAVNAYADYHTLLGKHEISALAGFNQEWKEMRNFWGKAQNMITSELPVMGQTLGDEYTGDGESHWAIRGAFFSLNYVYDNRYLLEVKGRYDGTSKFPTNDRYKFFPSVSLGWRISEESFMESTKTVLNNLKVRGSWGRLGNQNVDNYIYVPSYGTTSQVNHIFGDKRPAGVTPPGLVSADLTWETATTIDFGLDALLFNKLDLTFDWYRRETTDILTDGDKLPSVLGATVPMKNSGTLVTKGWELSVKWRQAFENGLRYDLTFVLSDYKTKVTKFNGNPNKLLSGLYEGKTMGEIWGYKTKGFFQSEEEIANAPTQERINSGKWYPGDIQYENLDGDDKISDGEKTVANPGDKRIIGNSTPRYQFGFTGNVAWKGIDLNIFFQGIGKRDSWISNRAFWGYISGGTPIWSVYNNSWTPERRNAYYPAHTSSSGKNAQVQTKYLQNSAYLRLKNLALGYTIPERWTKKAYIQKLRLYVSGNNLFEVSGLKNKDIDPETLSANYPMTRSYAFGIQVTF